MSMLNYNFLEGEGINNLKKKTKILYKFEKYFKFLPLL